jgi:hypothetical protein
MKRWLWLLAASLPLVAQPKLLVNARVDTRSAGGGLEREFQTLLAAQPQPAWIGYEVPSVPDAGLNCEYVRDTLTAPGVIHLEPPGRAVVLVRVEAQAAGKIRILSPDCEIDAGGLALHWLAGVGPAESVTLLAGFVTDRKLATSAVAAIASHADPAADVVLDSLVQPAQPEWLRRTAVFLIGSQRGSHGAEIVNGVIANDPSEAVRRRAVESLGSRRDGAGVPLLIELVKTSRDAAVRKQAMTALEASRDPRAGAFFEELLK